MKKYIAILVIFALAVFLPFGEGAVWADDDSEQSIHAEISVGASVNGNQDSPNKASEYRSLSDEDTVGVFGGSVDVRSGGIEFGAEGMRITWMWIGSSNSAALTRNSCIAWARMNSSIYRRHPQPREWVPSCGILTIMMTLGLT